MKKVFILRDLRTKNFVHRLGDSGYAPVSSPEPAMRYATANEIAAAKGSIRNLLSRAEIYYIAEKPAEEKRLKLIRELKAENIYWNSDSVEFESDGRACYIEYVDLDLCESGREVYGEAEKASSCCGAEITDDDTHRCPMCKEGI